MASTRPKTGRTARKKAAGRKAPAKKTASRQGPRSSRHGNVSYFSVAREHPECSPLRCSPPYRRVDKPTGAKTTLVKYSHRSLTITSPRVAGSAKKAAKKTTAKRTAKKKKKVR